MQNGEVFNLLVSVILITAVGGMLIGYDLVRGRIKKVQPDGPILSWIGSALIFFALLVVLLITFSPPEKLQENADKIRSIRSIMEER